VTIAKEAFAWLMTFGLSKLAAPLTWGTRAMEKGTRASRAGTTQAAQRAAAQTGTQAAPGATQAASTAGTTVAAAIDKEAIRAAARETFARANPTVVMNKIVVHHRVELQVLEKYPGRFTVAELNQAHMLRGIPKGTVNSIVHNSIVRNLWNDFYRRFPNATREQILKFADTVDRVALKLPLPVK
jgi:hypothetical protein